MAGPVIAPGTFDLKSNAMTIEPTRQPDTRQKKLIEVCFKYSKKEIHYKQTNDLEVNLPWFAAIEV